MLLPNIISFLNLIMKSQRCIGKCLNFMREHIIELKLAKIKVSPPLKCRYILLDMYCQNCSFLLDWWDVFCNDTEISWFQSEDNIISGLFSGEIQNLRIFFPITSFLLNIGCLRNYWFIILILLLSFNLLLIFISLYSRTLMQFQRTTCSKQNLNQWWSSW